MTKFVNSWNVGSISYSNGLKLQKIISDRHHLTNNEIKDTFLFLEHPPVYTVGLRSKSYTKEDEIRLKALGNK